ncbi:Mu P family protein [Rhizobium rosettiformans]|uniref:Mu P family protein n=1 Tax=Rhizobium rosettiformans TaxID=1368430 RepID=A0ABX7EWX7_9HYPH|nr:Mu P family protein [Rhizobium rosettiformans]QRF51636.1 Mu P family protein [Rhizobium rosettiformans]
MAKSIKLSIDGVAYDQWVSAEVTRDLKDFSGAFSFTFRDKVRSRRSLPFATNAAVRELRPGPAVEIRIGRRLVLKGFVERVDPDSGDRQASIVVSGRDVTGDLIDGAAMANEAEFFNVKLEEAARRIAAPYGLSVRSEIDTGEPFSRYGIDLAETAFSAIEKGARSRHALVLSDGIGGIIITRTGQTRAPVELRYPGNVLYSRGSFSHEGRYSETIVRGQGEKAGKARGSAALDSTAEPIASESREDGDGSATEKERKGTVATGRARDEEITRHRPIVHLARSKADNVSAQDEADWRMRTARAEGEQFTHTMKGHTIAGEPWTVNQIAAVSDAFLGVYRDLLISQVKFLEDAAGIVTELGYESPEAFDKAPVGDRRTNKSAKTAKRAGGMDATAEAL